MNNDQPYIEPNADTRASAQQLMATRNAMEEVGFTREECMYLLGQSMMGAALGQSGNE